MASKGVPRTAHGCGRPARLGTSSRRRSRPPGPAPAAWSETVCTRGAGSPKRAATCTGVPSRPCPRRDVAMPKCRTARLACRRWGRGGGDRRCHLPNGRQAPGSQRAQNLEPARCPCKGRPGMQSLAPRDARLRPAPRLPRSRCALANTKGTPAPHVGRPAPPLTLTRPVEGTTLAL